MATLELVEKLREKANVTFEAAKEALDASGDDLLDALIYLERQGKTAAPAGNGFYSSDSAPAGDAGRADGQPRRNGGAEFKTTMRGLGRFMVKLIQKGNENYLDMLKNGSVVLSCPVTALALLLVFLFWLVVPAIIVSLFLGCRYRFSGAELGREDINRVIEKAEDAVDGVKSSFENKNS
jgi:hypothetical protein